MLEKLVRLKIEQFVLIDKIKYQILYTIVNIQTKLNLMIALNVILDQF